MLPRVLALVLMMPLLTLYADLVGILGGALVGVTVRSTCLVLVPGDRRRRLRLIDFAVGLVKAVVFGAIVALAGCLRGMQAAAARPRSAGDDLGRGHRRSS